eukprot:TRINITY_DN5320_c0_g1_i1.p1 TRINITY_DN5320_c0_g1~~TRINITY_DN5320_c0_g1_i1.p1  ORF type:complete len:385 (+),score=117.50 TRINITY_DN5320_c0_g1_i1:124-1278(+)
MEKKKEFNFLEVKTENSTQNNNIDTKCEIISVMQYNILAGNLASKEHFPYVKEEILCWESRREKIYQQVVNILKPDLPDFVCFEECNDYWSYFQKNFSKIGLQSVYSKRPSLHISSWSGRFKEDGCAIFYNERKWELIDEKTVVYSDEHDRLGLILALRKIDNNRIYFVGNTHLYWNVQKIEDQLRELKEFNETVCLFINEINSKFGFPFYNKNKKEKETKFDNKIPLIICGDFNNTPNSKIYEYVLEKFGEENKIKMRSCYDIYKSISLDREKVFKNFLEIESGESFEPDFTTFNFKRNITIDFIFYNSFSFEVLKLLELPSVESLQNEDGPEEWEKNFQSSKISNDESENKSKNGIPNSVHPSDHLPILSILKLKNNQINKI